MFKEWKIILILLLMSSVSGFLSCDNSSGSTNNNIISIEDEVKLGGQLNQQISGDTKENPYLNSTFAIDYLQNIIKEIIKSPFINYTDVFHYNIHIIQRNDIINAFSVPGGYIYIYTGLLKFIDDEATLAAILAHEIAHVERRHAIKRMTKQFGAGYLVNLLTGKNTTKWQEIGTNLLSGLALLKNSRDEEYEADNYSFKYLQSTKWYPGAITFFFKKIDENTDSSIFDELFSTHPKSEDRETAVKDLIKNAGLADPSESNIFTQRYLQFKSILP
jgi:beta-barrel assembly-enhancing protease